MALSKFNFNSFDVTSVASTGLGFNASANGFSTFNPGSMTLIKTLTASSSSTISFVHGSSDVVFDSTYPFYLFKFINIHPASNDYHFQMNLTGDSGSNYNVEKLTTFFRARHKEDDSLAHLEYSAGFDVASATTTFATISDSLSNNDDASTSGELYFFNPASTTFVKHFLSRFNSMQNSPLTADTFTTGFANSTSAVNGIQFKVNSGNIDSGTFKLYGIKDS